MLSSPFNSLCGPPSIILSLFLPLKSLLFLSFCLSSLRYLLLLLLCFYLIYRVHYSSSLVLYNLFFSLHFSTKYIKIVYCLFNLFMLYFVYFIFSFFFYSKIISAFLPFFSLSSPPPSISLLLSFLYNNKIYFSSLILVAFSILFLVSSTFCSVILGRCHSLLFNVIFIFSSLFILFSPYLIKFSYFFNLVEFSDSLMISSLY